MTVKQRIDRIREKLSEIEAAGLEAKAMSDTFSLERFQAHAEIGPEIIKTVHGSLSMMETGFMRHPEILEQIEKVLGLTPP